MKRHTASGSVSASSYTGSSSRSTSASLSRSRSGSRKSRSLSVSSVSSVSSASSGTSSSVRSADSEDMYADLASPVSSASSRSPTPGHHPDAGGGGGHPPPPVPGGQPLPPHAGGGDTLVGGVTPEADTQEGDTQDIPAGRGPARPVRGRRTRETGAEVWRPLKKDEPFREDRRKMDPSAMPPRGGNFMPRMGPGNRGGHHMHHMPGNMGPPGNYGGSGSHKDIKLTLLNKQQQGDRGNRKRYMPSDKERPGSPLSKRMAMSPGCGRDRRMPGRPIFPPRMDRPRGPGPRPMPPQGDSRKRPLSPPAKSSGKGPSTPSGKPAAPGMGGPAGSGGSAAGGSGSAKPSNTLSRREELLKQLKAVEDAIARKRAKIPAK
ncbi:hypothetical protein CRUP_007763 [Coryphaenoides rupestris]|nr:hypothetical protein CRUP_007763 [Coryphaenoides rupestris]